MIFVMAGGSGKSKQQKSNMAAKFVLQTQGRIFWGVQGGAHPPPPPNFYSTENGVRTVGYYYYRLYLN
jgi:hypothetical protein